MRDPRPTVLAKRLRKVLVVEDEPSALKVLEHALQKWNFLVVGAATKREALEASTRTAFHLAVVDLGLPDGTGEDLIRELRRSLGPDEAPPVLVLSGSAEAAAAWEWEGVVGVVTKPYDTLALIEIVKLHSAPRPAPAPPG